MSKEEKDKEEIIEEETKAEEKDEVGAEEVLSAGAPQAGQDLLPSGRAAPHLAQNIFSPPLRCYPDKME